MSAVPLNIESRCMSESPESTRVSTAMCRRAPIPETLSLLESTCTVSNANDNQSQKTRTLFDHYGYDNNALYPNSSARGTADTFSLSLLDAIAIDLYGVTIGSSSHHWTPSMGSYQRPRLIFYRNNTILHIYANHYDNYYHYNQINAMRIPKNPALFDGHSRFLNIIYFELNLPSPDGLPTNPTLMSIVVDAFCFNQFSSVALGLLPCALAYKLREP